VAADPDLLAHRTARTQAASFHVGGAAFGAGPADSALEAIRSTWSVFLPDRPFEYEFLDDRIAAEHRSTEQLAVVFGIASSAGIGIACLGLLGLVSYTTRQRVQEIGVRKVLGAGPVRILALVYRDPLVLDALAAAVALPCAYRRHRGGITVFPKSREILVQQNSALSPTYI